MMGEKHSSEIPKSYTGIYSMHKYWSKKPHDVINKYIETYTSPEDIILEPFLGYGVGSIESVLLNRRTVGIDINPMSTFITKQILEKVDPQSIDSEFNKLKSKIHKKINDLYKISIGGESFAGSHFIYKNDKLMEIWYKDGNVKKTVDVTKAAPLRASKQVTHEDVAAFISAKRLIENSRINAKTGMFVHDLFTPRNMMALSMILAEINKVQNPKSRDFLRFCFTACVGQASKMVFVIKNRGKAGDKRKSVAGKKEVGSWVVGYWIPKEHFEINAWNCFENRYRKNLKSKKEFLKLNLNIDHVKNFKELVAKKGNMWLINDDCYKRLKKLPDNSIDYVITDPPHGDRLPYMELSLMWNDWLGFERDMKDELVVSDAKTRNKTVAEYVMLLKKILIEINRVLKDGKYFTLMFNSYDDQVWMGLQSILFDLDLKLSDVSTIGYSAPSVVQDSRKGGLKTDFIFTFEKKTSIENKKHGVADDSMIDKLILTYMGNNEDHSMYRILNYVIIYLVRNGLIFSMGTVMSLIALRDRR